MNAPTGASGDHLKASGTPQAPAPQAAAPQAPAPKSRPRRTLALGTLFLGGVLLAAAVTTPMALVPQLKKIPLEINSHTTTTPVKSVLLDAKAFATGEVLPARASNPQCQPSEQRPAAQLPVMCFTHEDIELESTRQVQAIEPSNAKVITLQVGNQMLRLDREGEDALVAATIDTVTLRRNSAFPEDGPNSSFQIVPATAAGSGPGPVEFERDGLQYQFPFGAEETSYAYYDVTAGRDYLIDFVDQEDFSVPAQEVRPEDGIDPQVVGKVRPAYHYAQQVPVTDVFKATSEQFQLDGQVTAAEKGALAALRLKSIAGRWYSPQELAAQGRSYEDPVVMTRYYTNLRDIWVEPNTGAIVRGQEFLYYFYAENDEQAAQVAAEFGANPDAAPSPYRTAMQTKARWSGDTQARQYAKAAAGADSLLFLRRIVGALYGLAAVLLVAGFWLWRRQGQR